MDRRHDAGLAAAAAALRIEAIGRGAGGMATTGALSLRPGIATAVAGEAELTVDLRHADERALATMLAESSQAVAAAAAERACEATAERIWRIEPTPFDTRLVEAARAACGVVAGVERSLTSGALHDAAQVARVVPAAMVFVPSRGGISHARVEDTPVEDLHAGIEAFALLANRLLAGEVA
jgi:N-carbamoyl-L-amino-acid hydrolase